MREPADARTRYEHALVEVAEIKRTLAERARHVAELEARLMLQVEEGARGGRSGRRTTAAPEPTESDLARAVAAADAEKALAQAEREQLEERERGIRKVERQLAGLRIELEKEWHRVSGGSPLPADMPADVPASAPISPQPAQRDRAAASPARRRTTKRQ